MRGTIGSARSAGIGLALLLSAALATPAPADDDTKFKAEIDAFALQLNVATHGVVTWEGDDAVTVKNDNGTEIATITNPRIAIKAGDAGGAHLTFDRVEMRRKPDADGKHVRISVALPTQSKLVASDGTEVKLSLKDAIGDMTVDAPGGRVRESAFTFASARIEHPGSGAWINFGPLTVATKTDAQPDGSWKIPTSFELKQIEFFVPDGPVGGTIDRIAYTGQASGPDLASLDKTRDDLASLRQEKGASPEEHMHDLLALLPNIMAAFGEAKGEITVEGIAVRAANAEPLFAVAKSSVGGALSGIAGETAALRITLRNEGLTVANSILPDDKVPHRVVLDFGVEDVSTAALRKIIDIAGEMSQAGKDADQQKATQKLLGAAAMFNPVFRIYELDVEAKDAGIAATAETKGSPLAPKGYTADADFAVRGIDALPQLLGGAPYAAYLPLLKEIGNPASAPDGSPRLRYHLASAPQQWLTLNGVDVTGWFAGDKPGPGQPRVLRPAEPPMQGNDVKSVQRALAAAKIAAPQDGVYTGETAAAVARYQKQNGINPDGIVTAATRDKLGVKPEPSKPEPGKPAPAKPDGPAGGGGKAPTPGWGHK